MFCTCPEMPACEWAWCRFPADHSVYQPRWGARAESFKFMCDAHFEIYRDAMTKPIKGLTRPEGADDEWRPSFMDMIRHATIAIAFENRNKIFAPSVPGISGFPGDAYWHDYESKRGYTPEQRANAARHRALIQRYSTVPPAAQCNTAGGDA